MLLYAGSDNNTVTATGDVEGDTDGNGGGAGVLIHNSNENDVLVTGSITGGEDAVGITGNDNTVSAGDEIASSHGDGVDIDGDNNSVSASVWAKRDNRASVLII